MELTYIIQKSRRRSISVSVQPDNRVLVKAPYLTTERTIKDFLISKKDWITKQIEKHNKENEQASVLGFISEDELKKIRRIAKKEIPERVAYWAEKNWCFLWPDFYSITKFKMGKLCSKWKPEF